MPSRFCEGESDAAMWVLHGVRAAKQLSTLGHAACSAREGFAQKRKKKNHPARHFHADGTSGGLPDANIRAVDFVLIQYEVGRPFSILRHSVGCRDPPSVSDFESIYAQGFQNSETEERLMAKFNKCFERFEGGYREISYSLLFVDGERNPEYADRYFLPVSGYLLEVPQEDYVDFYKEKRRRKYTHEESVLHGEISYDALDNDELIGEELLRDIFTDVEDEAITNVMVFKLRQALFTLSEKEMELVVALFFHEKSERKLSEETGVPNMTIHDRKVKVLAKLKKLLKN